MENKFKIGDIVYTREFSIGIFQIQHIEGNKVYNHPSGWVYIENGLRFAEDSDFVGKERHHLYPTFLKQNNREINYEIY